MDALAVWLLLLAVLRMSSAYSGYFNIWALRTGVYSQTDMTEIHGRTFATWTTLTCVMCIVCALNLRSRPLYLCTLISFALAMAHFAVEFFVFHTMSALNVGLIAPFASISLVWMCLCWSKYGEPAKDAGKAKST